METAIEMPRRLGQLADRLACLTEDDVILLADVTPSTLETWRKRGEGPSYIRAGNRYLYPQAGISDWLNTRVRERKQLDAKGVL